MNQRIGAWSVVVSNVGVMYTTSEATARRMYDVYVELSENGGGAVAGEDVTLVCRGEIVAEHQGRSGRRQDAADYRP